MVRANSQIRRENTRTTLRYIQYKSLLSPPHPPLLRRHNSGGWLSAQRVEGASRKRKCNIYNSTVETIPNICLFGAVWIIEQSLPDLSKRCANATTIVENLCVQSVESPVKHHSECPSRLRDTARQNGSRHAFDTLSREQYITCVARTRRLLPTMHRQRPWEVSQFPTPGLFETLFVNPHPACAISPLTVATSEHSNFVRGSFEHRAMPQTKACDWHVRES